ncbi:MAG: ATP-binding protein [Deltaproteobacteria bacterium]|nr:ATP-binding protein [Deltaproteobacteria bacterium]
MTLFKLGGNINAMKRVYGSWIEKLATNKFLFLTGPRQVGKTTLGLQWTKKNNGSSLNWDIPEDREKILENIFTKRIHSIQHNYLLLDEIHKYQRWKAALKGLFDRKVENLHLVITGSAKMDTYQKGGDSLLGRYEYLRIYPLTIGELSHCTFKKPPENWRNLKLQTHDEESMMQKLESLSGFPEPYLSNDLLKYNRWSTLRRSNLIRQDLRDISDVRFITLVDHLTLLLKDRIGAPLSLNSLRQDIQIGFDTVSHWIELLERLYYLFRISPFSKKIQRSLSKEKKAYLLDWAQIKDSASRFENLIACHLLKSIHFWKDLGYGDYELNYFRDKDKREIDFIITLDRRPIVAIECKFNSDEISSSFFQWKKYYPKVPCYQLIRKPGVSHLAPSGIHIVSAGRFLNALN